MKKVSFLCFVLLVCIGLLAGCTSTEPPVSSDSSSSESSLPASEPSQPLEENDAASEETPAESGDTPTGLHMRQCSLDTIKHTPLRLSHDLRPSSACRKDDPAACPWQMAIAKASATSSGLGICCRHRSRREGSAGRLLHPGLSLRRRHAV